MDHDLAEIGFDVGEEFDAFAETAIAHLNHDQHREHDHDRDTGTRNRAFHEPHIGAAVRDAVVMRHR